MHARTTPQRRHLLPALLLVGVAIGGCTNDAPVAPTRAGAPLASRQTTTSGRILFTGISPTLAGDSVTHVFSMDDDGTNIVQLTTSNSVFASWAPDGKRILFTTLNTLEDLSFISVMNPDGTGVTSLTSPPSTCVDVYPEALGKQVVFSRACFASSISADTLYLMNADGTGLTPLDDNGVVASGLTASPKGGQVAYGKDGDIWLLDVSTGARTNLTRASATAASFDPAFSPSGKQIAFARTIYTGGGGIFVMNADGTGVTQLTSTFADDFPQWSPDGKRIAFAHPVALVVGNGGVIEEDVLVMNADGTGITDITGQSLGNGLHYAAPSAWTR